MRSVARAASWMGLVLALCLALFSRGSTWWLLVSQLVFVAAAVALTYFSTTSSRDVKSWSPSLRMLLIAYVLAILPLAWWLGRAPTSGDESAYLFQGRIFAGARLAAQAPTAGNVTNNSKNEFFLVHHVIHEGKWFGKYPPGWPALLAAGHLVRLEWLVNPLLGLLLLWLTYRIGCYCFDRTAAGLAGLVLLLSPMFLMNCVGYYSHVLAAVLVAGGFFFALVAVKDARPRAFLPAFACLSAAIPVRPYTAAALIGVALLALLVEVCRNRRAWRVALTCLAILAIGVFLLLAYQRALTGSYTYSTYALYRGADTASEVRLDPASLLANLKWLTPRALLKTCAAIFLFPLMLAWAAWSAIRRGAVRRERLWLGALCLVLPAAYVVQPEMSATIVGERYYFEILFAFCLLAGYAWASSPFWTGMPRRAGVALLAAAIALQSIHCGWFGHILRQRVEPFQRIQQALRREEFRNAVVFLRTTPDFPAADFNSNDADWQRSPTISLPDPGASRRPAVAAALGRSKWAVLSYMDGVATVEWIAP